ncbi:MAG: nucleoside diphosphate kinase regulator [Lentimicrobiaceae bacterium]|nr:nucleoside diphosphate kinase regulator [Lentimicrobiaceae bacterium]
MKEILVSTKDMARLRERIDIARSGGLKAPVNLSLLISELDRAKVLPPEKMPADVITMNSIITMEYVNSSKTMQIQLVYPEDADVSKQKISIFAPVATALLGYRIGDIVEWKIPTGIAQMKVTNIVYQPEASGDFNI